MGPTLLAWQRRAHRAWRRRLRPAWRRRSAVALPLVAIAVVVLGAIGYSRYDSAHHPGFWESLYHAVALFALNGGVSNPPPIPWEFEVARFLAPLLVFYAAVQALIRISREPFQLAAIRALARGHIVVAGLGDVGLRVATAFHDADEYVVVIEADPNHPRVEDLRDRGIRVLTGSAHSARVLAQARLDRARHLIIDCGRDAINVDIAAVAESAVRGRTGVLTAFAHLRDLRLWRMLKAEAVAIINEPGFRLEFFNVFATAARIMLERHPPFDESELAAGVPHVCFVGLDGVGEELVLNVAGAWRNQSVRDERLPVTLAGPAADEDCEMLLAHYPELAEIIDLRPRVADIASAALQSGAVLMDEDGTCIATRVYVSLASAAEALAAALGLHGSPATMRVPIVVTVTDTDSGTAEVLASDEGRMANVDAFGIFTEALTPDLVLGGMNEALARAKHAEYLDLRRTQGTFDPREPSNWPWERLPEVFKDSNRRFADRIGRKLQEGGWGIIPAPLIDCRAPLMSLSDEEVEAMARLEHDGWVADLRRDGWRPTTGPKDPDRKLHPMLVTWEELSEEERDKDRSPVRELPRMLARAGFELYRQSDGAVPGATERTPTPGRARVTP